MARQLTLRARTPPAVAQTLFNFDTNRVIMDEPTILQRAIVSKVPLLGEGSQSEILGYDAPEVTIGAHVHTTLWAEHTPDITLQLPDIHLLYPLNIWFAQGNQLTFIPRGYTRLPRWHYRITEINEVHLRNLYGAVWQARYEIKFIGASQLPP